MIPISSSFSSNLAAAWARPSVPKALTNPGGSMPEGVSSLSAPKPEARFGDLLSEMVRRTDETQKVSANTTGALLSGQNVPVHQVMIASEEAGVSFQLMLEVRNKLLEGYQELMRMQV